MEDKEVASNVKVKENQVGESSERQNKEVTVL